MTLVPGHGKAGKPRSGDNGKPALRCITARSEGPLKRADVVITVSSSVDTIIFPDHLKKGPLYVMWQAEDLSAQVAKRGRMY